MKQYNGTGYPPVVLLHSAYQYISEYAFADVDLSNDGHELKLEGHVVEPLPGHHSVIYSAVRAETELLPGWLYRLESRCYPGVRARADVVWIKDADRVSPSAATRPCRSWMAGKQNIAMYRIGRKSACLR
jgi:hypothetical protein